MSEVIPKNLESATTEMNRHCNLHWKLANGRGEGGGGGDNDQQLKMVNIISVEWTFWRHSLMPILPLFTVVIVKVNGASFVNCQTIRCSTKLTECFQYNIIQSKDAHHFIPPAQLVDREISWIGWSKQKKLTVIRAVGSQRETWHWERTSPRVLYPCIR